MDDIDILCSKFDMDVFKGLGTIDDYKQLIETKKCAMIKQEEVCKAWIEDMKTMNRNIDDISIIMDNVLDESTIDFSNIILDIANTNTKILNLANNISNIDDVVLNSNKIIYDFKNIDEKISNMKKNFKTIFADNTPHTQRTQRINTRYKKKHSRTGFNCNTSSFKIHYCKHKY